MNLFVISYCAGLFGGLIVVTKKMRDLIDKYYELEREIRSLHDADRELFVFFQLHERMIARIIEEQSKEKRND